MLVLGSCVWGCNAVPLTSPFWSEAERREEAAAYLTQGVQADTDGDHDRADRHLELAVLLLDEDGEGVFLVAQHLLDEVKPDTAVLLLEKAILQPGGASNPLLYGVLARAFTMHGKRSQSSVERCQKQAQELVRAAQELLEKSVPRNEPEREARMRLLFSAGRYCVEFSQEVQKAIVLLRGATALGDPSRLTRTDARVRSYLGLTLAQHPEWTKDRREAATLTRQAAFYDTQNPRLLYAHGVALLHQGEAAGAQRVLREAADLDSNNPEIRCALGQAYAQQKLFTQAALELDRALLLRPRYAQAALERKNLPTPLPAPATLPEEELY